MWRLIIILAAVFVIAQILGSNTSYVQVGGDSGNRNVVAHPQTNLIAQNQGLRLANSMQRNTLNHLKQHHKDHHRDLQAVQKVGHPFDFCVSYARQKCQKASNYDACYQVKFKDCFEPSLINRVMTDQITAEAHGYPLSETREGDLRAVALAQNVPMIKPEQEEMNPLQGPMGTGPLGELGPIDPAMSAEEIAAETPIVDEQMFPLAQQQQQPNKCYKEMIDGDMIQRIEIPCEEIISEQMSPSLPTQMDDLLQMPLLQEQTRAEAEKILPTQMQPMEFQVTIQPTGEANIPTTFRDNQLLLPKKSHMSVQMKPLPSVGRPYAEAFNALLR